MPRLTIIIVTYNSTGHIDACLRSLTAYPPRIEHEVLVVDNASQDGTVELVRGNWPAVRVLEPGANIGFAAANNAGIRQSSGELLLLLNPDTVVPRGATDALVGHLDARHDAAVVGPRLIDEDGRPELSFGAMITPLAELRQKILVKGHARGIPLISTYVHRITRESREVDWVSGACLLVRRADAKAVGLLDERYFMYTEDVDFCAGIRARGRKVLFEAGVEVRHLRGRSAMSAPTATASAYRRSQLAFYGKHHPGLVGPLRLYLKLRGVLPDTQRGPGP
ncbi:MAG: glycosyltransferase family 2 protein [Acidobacteria bacterium]|nr:glycosyltransferase family 2 protein [Acidobacteriota bacterium]